MKIRSGDLVFDIGAHVGRYTFEFRLQGARVVAVEPQERAFAELSHRFGKDENVYLVHGACGERVSTGKIFICDVADTLSTMNPAWQHGRFHDYTWSKSEIVVVVTLDSLVETYGLPIYIKIDVEGYEKEVLRGLSKTIKYITFSYVAEDTDNMRACLEYLNTLGNYEYSATVSDADTTEIPFTNSVDVDKWVRKMSLERPYLFGNIVARLKGNEMEYQIVTSMNRETVVIDEVYESLKTCELVSKR